MSKQQIVITGADGQLGLTLQALWPETPLNERFDLCCSDVAQLDITDPDQLNRVLDGERVACIINAAAYTAVDRAETEPGLAHKINGDGPRNLAAWAAQHRARLVQVSTDFVFDGSKDSPYRPGDQPNPLGVYGASKLAGELAVQEELPERSVIVRTSWLYSPYQGNFVKTMIRLMSTRDALNVVADQRGCPTSSRSLGVLLLGIVNHAEARGVYHWCDAGEASWYDFALVIQDLALAAGLLERKIEIHAVTTAEYPTPASRPAYSVLDVANTVAEFQCRPQNWKAELEQVIDELARHRELLA